MTARTTTAPTETADDATVAFVRELIIQAGRARASDIHIDPLQDGKTEVRFRIDGVLRDAGVGPVPDGHEVKERIKEMACLEMGVNNLPQDGRIMLKVEGHDLDIRVSVLPVVYGERLVMRLLDQRHLNIELERVVADEDDRRRVRELLGLSHGVIACTGPTGCGKTTLLYSMLAEVTGPEVCTVSVEDPVEYRLPGVAQTQVRPALGLTFASCLRAILRQDPDVIMAGEIRDRDTANLVAQAALTGHLVVTTLHTNTAADAIRRFVDIGLPPFVVNASLAGVIAQRLVRHLCPECRQPAEPDRTKLPPAVTNALDAHSDATFYRAVGCPQCAGGFRGRRAVQEILIPTEAVRREVMAGCDVDKLKAIASEEGMRTMMAAGLRLAAAGHTTLDELVRALPHG
jgi:type II secretory ATPase GspE/PulE/Tfp pilus assembly ATPase PilB-like protein